MIADAIVIIVLIVFLFVMEDKPYVCTVKVKHRAC